MTYKIELSENFKKEAKRLIKKYRSLKAELAALVKELALDPKKGVSLGRDIYKVRLSIASKVKGKSGGARVLTFVNVMKKTVILFSIYDKGEQSNISSKELQALING